MNYRKDKYGNALSILGFGCMRFPEYEKDGAKFVDQDKVDEMIAYAYQLKDADPIAEMYFERILNNFLGQVLTLTRRTLQLFSY